MLEAFVYQCVYTLRVFECLRVYARKRIAMMPDARIVKMLIQSAFTSPAYDSKPVYRQHPIWG
jgi:hypothetical protein